MNLYTKSNLESLDVVMKVKYTYDENNEVIASEDVTAKDYFQYTQVGSDIYYRLIPVGNNKCVYESTVVTEADITDYISKLNGDRTYTHDEVSVIFNSVIND